MLAAWLWTIPSCIAIGVFAVIIGNAVLDYRAAQARGDRRDRAIARERALTAFGLFVMSVFQAFVGVISLVEPPGKFKLIGKLALWAFVSVPTIHLLIGVNIVIGRKAARLKRAEEQDDAT